MEGNKVKADGVDEGIGLGSWLARGVGAADGETDGLFVVGDGLGRPDGLVEGLLLSDVVSWKEGLVGRDVGDILEGFMEGWTVGLSTGLLDGTGVGN